MSYVSRLYRSILALMTANIYLKSRKVSTKSLPFLCDRLFVGYIFILILILLMNPQDKFSQQLLNANLRIDGR